MKILRPKYWISITLVLILLIGLVGLFFYWQLGLIGIAFAIIGFRIADVFANEFDLQTVGQVAEKISRENYLKARRTPNTVNRFEISKKVTELFRNDLDLDETDLTRQASFV